MLRLIFILSLLALTVGCDRRIGESSADLPTDDTSRAPAADVAVNEASHFSTHKTNDPKPAADNTAINARDRERLAPTPLDQGTSQADIDITASIRMRIVEQPMSINAHNVKIITRDGKVTLRGPVASEKEKQFIEQVAEKAVGAKNVDSMLEVK